MTRLTAWFESLSARGQWAAGCLGVVVMATACLYGLGIASWFARPALVSRPSSPTPRVFVPTALPRATSALTVAPPTLALPGSTLESTPTQAPIPTHAPTLPTLTVEPTFEFPNVGSPFAVTVTPFFATPTWTPVPTVTPEEPTRTPRPTRVRVTDTPEPEATRTRNPNRTPRATATSAP